MTHLKISKGSPENKIIGSFLSRRIRMTESKKVDFKERFETCPDCGYENGFHMILIKDPHARLSEMKFQLKCPSCAQIYDLNLYCTLKQ